MAKYEDLTGKKFGMLSVLGLSGTKISKMPGWSCQCDCGGTKVVARYHLTTGAVSSCGCKITYDSKRFTQDSKKVHGEFYDYSKVNYTASQSFVTIICPIHGAFEQRASIHMMGSGCQKCAGIRMGAAHVMSAEDFQNKTATVRDDFYYDLSTYRNATTPMEFVCKTHNTTHKQTPAAFLTGAVACKDCRGLMNNKETFVKKAKEIHGPERYDYSLVDYVSSKKKVTIICSSGHVFQQTPHNHTAGKHGCPSCGPCGFDALKDSWLYILVAEGMTKIGITNRSADIRRKSIAKSAGTPFEVFAEYKLEGQFCSDLETTLLKQYRARYESPAEVFQGSSECFINLCPTEVESDITNYIEKHYGETTIRTRLGDTQDIPELQE